MARARTHSSALPALVGGVVLLSLLGVGAAVAASPAPQRPRSRPGPSSPPPPPAGPPPAPPPGLSAQVLARLDHYAELIDQAAQQAGVDATILRGLIAAETGGKPTSESSAGYKGLIQASRDQEDVDPAVSLRKGAKKVHDFTASLARQLGTKYTALGRWDQVRWLARAYNAGPRTVAKAIEYGGAGWTEAEPYQRALLHTGAYATPQQHKEAERWRLQLDHRNLTMAQARKEGMPAFVEQAIVAKWQHTGPYVEKVVAYARHYAHAQEPRA